MKNVLEITLEKTGETRGYYLFSIIVDEKNPPMFPKKIYVKKELFTKEPKFVQMAINLKDGKK